MRFVARQFGAGGATLEMIAVDVVDETAVVGDEGSTEG